MLGYIAPNINIGDIMKIRNTEPGEFAIIAQEKNGRIVQYGMTVNQSKLLQNFLSILSQESPLVKMNEEHDLLLRSSVCDKCRNKFSNKE